MPSTGENCFTCGLAASEGREVERIHSIQCSVRDHSMFLSLTQEMSFKYLDRSFWTFDTVSMFTSTSSFSDIPA